MVSLSNSTLTTLESKYFDDFDENKQYYRILFRPATSVQARELTQLQTMMQLQVSRFADHVFKDGSVVTGCAPLMVANADFVRVLDSFSSNTTYFTSMSDLNDTYTLTNGVNSNTAVRARIYKAVAGFQSNYPDTNVIYVRYLYTGKDGSNNDVTSFANGDTLYVYSANQNPIGQLSNTNILSTISVFTTNTTANAAVGQGYLVSVTDGQIYQKGFIQKVDKQLVVVNKYVSDSNNSLVGFETTESIVTEYQDTSLNDNANGSSNYNAPGAHRLKLVPTLVVKSKTDTTNKDFFPIVEFDSGKAVMSQADAQYASLGDRIAKEKYEESGDYNVVPHAVETTAHSSNAALFVYNASPGISYVKGRRVELIGTRTANAERASTTAIQQNKILTANYGNYVYCKEVLGAMNFDKLGEVILYDAAQAAITDREGLSGGVTGNIVGYANIKSVLHYDGTKGTAGAQYYVYIFNIRMNVGKAFKDDVKSMYSAGTGGYSKFKADLVLESSKAVIYDSTFTPMIFDTGYKAVKSLSAPTRDTTFYYRKTTSSTLNSNGFMSFTLGGGLGPAGGEQLYNTSSRDYQVILTANSYSANVGGTVSLYSTVNSTASNSTATFVVGTTTTFETSFKVGDTIRISNTTAGTPAIYTVGGIASNTSMYVTPAATANSVANTYQKYYQDGSILNLTDAMLSVNTTSNTFTVSTGITFDAGAGNTVYAQYPVQKGANTAAVQSAKTVSKSRLVKIDCSNNITTSNGPWCLGIPDVIKINNIWVGTTYANTTSDRSAWFNFDNGQRDDSYDLATLTVKPAFKTNITGSTKILVDLDHLVTDTSSGIGYYSVDSYPISNDGITSNSTTISVAEIPLYKSKTANTTYDLRNCIDFRPIKLATANSIANTDFANTLITINPATSNANTWSISTYGQYHAEADSNMTADYEYYLGRRDLLLLGKTGQFTYTSGVPEIYPKKPLNNSEATVIAETFVPPFPSLTMREAEDANRRDLATSIVLTSNRRYTMRDIGVLENRINRLEYYTVLTTLEKQAKDMSIPDATGNDRFKNGIFAEPFNSHNLGDVNNAEYRHAIDAAHSISRPGFKNHFIDFQYNAAESSGAGDIKIRGPYVMLAYTHEPFAANPYATNYRACTEKYWTWNGSVFLSPEADIFTDETNLPAINTTIDMASPLQDLMAAGALNAQVFGKQSSQSTQSQAVVDTTVPGGTNITTTTTTTTTNSQDITKISIGSSSETKTLTNAVVDVSQVDYIRSIDVAFYSKNLRPNSKLHVFMDDVNLDAYVAPGTLSVELKNFTYDKKAKEIVTTNAPKGTTLVANSSGCVAGIVTIPEKTFRAGDRRFMICDVDNLITGKNAILTKSMGTFHASGIAVTKQASTLTTVNPKIFTQQGKIVNTVVTKSSHVDFIPDPTPPDPVTESTGTGCCFDPDANVLMSDRTWKRIADIVAGDMVVGSNGTINVVKDIKQTIVANRKMVSIEGYDFYTTDDHLFLTKNGWKTWRPDRIINENRENAIFLEGENRYKPLNDDDILIMRLADGSSLEVKYSDLKITFSDFDSDFVVHDLHLDGDHTYVVDGFIVHNCDKGDPIAQSFMVTVPSDGSGHFVSKIDLYFKSKSTDKGISIFLVPLTAGIPDFSQILGNATLLASEVNVSDTGQTATTFEFDHPIYLSSGTDYAFVIEPEAHSPDYLIWTSTVGGFDVFTDEQVYKNPYDGVLFVSSNRASWTAYQSEDIKFYLYRARFVSSSGTAVLNNEADEYLTLTGVTKNYSSASITVGDVVYSSNATVANTNALAPFGIVQYYDDTTGTIILDSSKNGGFSNVAGSERIQIHRVQPYSNTSLAYSGASNTLIASANVATVDNRKYHTITPKFATMTPQNTKLDFSVKGTDTSYNFDSSWKTVTNEGMNELLDKERIVMSRSNEVAYLSSAKSAKIQINLTTNDSLVSPVIDLRRKSSYYIENIINNDLTNEQFTYGNAIAKYISKKVVLADGQDAEDLKVAITAYRPVNSDITAYAKFQSADDPESFDSKLWTKLTYLNDGDAVTSTQGKLDDYVEYEFGVPTGVLTTEPFNGLTGVSNTNDTIALTNNLFVNNQVVKYYTAAGNTGITIGSFTTTTANNTYWYVVNASSSSLQLSSSQGGSAQNLTAFSSGEFGHYLEAVIPTVINTAYLNPQSSPTANVIEYYNASGSRMQSFKYFSIKLVYTSSDRVNIPRVNDLRAIALQK